MLVLYDFFVCKWFVFSTLSSVLKSLLIKLINLILFFLFTIPFWLFGEFFKPAVIFILRIFSPFFVNSVLIKKFSQLLANIWLSVIKFYKWFKVSVLTKIYKKFIDFLFFDLYRNKDYFIAFFKKIKRCIYIFTFFYVFLYLNTWGLIFNYFFENFLESFIVLNISTFFGKLNICLSLLNLDNIVLSFYIIFFKIGILFILENSYIISFMKFGVHWCNHLVEFRTNDANFSFFKYFVDNLLSTISNSSVSLNLLDYNSTPIFFFFGVLFFSTVIISWFFFSYLGLYGIFKLNAVTLFLFWISLLFSAKSIFIGQKVYMIKLCSWVFLTINYKIDYYFLIDTISFSFILLTTTIAFFVYIYSFSYFRYEPLVDRFLLFILSFVISMIFLVASGNTIMLFLGWELIGLTSFCLINFWTTKAATLKSSFKAFTFNKVSDFFMFMFLVSTFSVSYTFDILSLNNQSYKYEFLSIYIFGTPVNYLEFVALMIIGAAFIKSAQFGGHAWLPDSMEAPVPASSLIHSATLVSAGIYLILRFNFIFDATQYSKFIIPLVGSFTAAYGGVCAASQSDIKKTLAYSTISHCGFLMVLCSTEMNEFTILYLYVHGFFKAGVFMCVGNILRITRGYQDTRRMGGLLKYLPFEYFCATVGLLNLAGLPFTFGFFIKHLLLTGLDTHMYIYTFIIFNSLVGAFSGLFYSYRIVYYTFVDFKKGSKALYTNANKINYNSTLYTNSSLAATLSVFCLFVVSYVIIYCMFKSLMANNFIFSDYMNTTTLSNYYSMVSSYYGYLLNFSYINITVICIFFALFFSKYRKIPRFFNVLQFFLQLFCLFVFTFLIFNLI